MVFVIPLRSTLTWRRCFRMSGMPLFMGTRKPQYPDYARDVAEYGGEQDYWARAAL